MFLFNYKHKNSIVFSEILSSIFIFLTWLKARVLYYINNWVYTTNHKRIAVNYFWFVILSGIVGMVLATIIRLELAYPGVGIFSGDSLQYLSMVSAHGVIMVFFMIMPLLFGAFANFLLPTQLGVHDVAFPRLNSAAFWFLPAGLIMLTQLVCVDRRYQRMNCFNIREVESLLKRRFFTDLTTTHEFTTLLNKTMIGLKYKLNNSHISYPHTLLLYQFGPSLANRYNNFNFNTRILTTHKINLLNPNSPFYAVIPTTTLKKIGKYYVVDNPIYMKFKDLTSFILPFEHTKFISIKPFTAIYTSSVVYPFLDINNFIYFKQLINLAIYHLYGWLHISFLYIYNKFYRLYRILYIIITFLPNNASYIWNNLEYDTFFNFEDSILGRRIYIRYFLFSLHIRNPILFAKIKRDDVLYYYFVAPFKQFTTLRYNFYNLTDFGWFMIPTPRFFLIDFILIVYNEILILYTIVFNIVGYVFLLLTEIKIINQFFFNPSNLFLLSSRHDVILSNKLKFFNEMLHLTNAQLLVIDKSTFIKNFDAKILPSQVGLYLYLFTSAVFNLPWAIYIFCRNLYNFQNLSVSISNFFAFVINWLLPTFFSIDITYLTGFFNSLLKISQYQFQLKTDTTFQFYIFFKNYYLDSTVFFKIIYIVFIKIPYILSFIIMKLNLFFQIIIKHIWSIWLQINFFAFFNNDLFTIMSQTLQQVYYSYKDRFFFSNDMLTYDSEYFNVFLKNNATENIISELSSTPRYYRFNDPIFKYDYKSGDYFPKLYKEIYQHLFTTILNITNGLKTNPWFKSAFFNEYKVFQPIILNHATGTTYLNQNNVPHFTLSFQTPLFFFNIENEFYNKRWVVLNTLNQKFYNMFLSSSMQQRIYANWRQLKFTREAWRCKLLSARHQKTLFRRYINEDGVFWSIERNAKDLLPGWAMITPFSSRTRFTAIGKVDIGLMGILLVLNSSIISGANFLVTYRYLSTLNNRKMRDARAFFTEGVLVTSWMMILANPMLVIGIVMLLSDRHWQTSFFDYSGGGDTVLFQHMFWFFGHPEVYIIMIPVFGFTNTILSYYLRKRVSARASLMYSMYTIAFLGFFVWGHHMYMVGLAHTTRMLFSTLTVMISVPAATKLMHWCVTMVNSSFTVELPFLFILMFIFFFVSGGISGMYVAHTGMDILFHDTFYVIGHFHVMLAGGAMFGSFGAFYFYFQAIFGVKYSRIYAYLHFTYYLIGQMMTVIPMFWLGYAGMPRRVLDYPASLGGWHSLISAGHMMSVAGLIAFFIMIFDSMRQGKAVVRNTFGINRFNTRLNFYLYEGSKLVHSQRKNLSLFKPVEVIRLKLNNKNFTNLEPLETTVYSYVFSKKKLVKIV